MDVEKAFAKNNEIDASTEEVNLRQRQTTHIIVMTYVCIETDENFKKGSKLTVKISKEYVRDLFYQKSGNNLIKISSLKFLNAF